MHSAQIMEQFVDNEQIIICSHSQAALKALSNPRITTRLVWDCIVALQQLPSHSAVKIFWDHGHGGIYGNTQADQLAKAASFKSYVGPEPVILVPTSVVQSQLQAWTLRETQTRWQDLKSCRQAKETIHGLNHRRTKEMLRLPRKTLRLIVNTGHNCPNRHLSVLGLTCINNPKFGNCNETDETALHYLCYCSHYGAVRTRILGKPFLHPSEVLLITVRDLLGFSTSSRRFS